MYKGDGLKKNVQQILSNQQPYEYNPPPGKHTQKTW